MFVPFIGLTAVEGRSPSDASLCATPVCVNELRRRTPALVMPPQAARRGLNAAKYMRWSRVSILDRMLGVTADRPLSAQ
jgi:hypothetical protein